MALIVAQQEQITAQQEQLLSRDTEIEHLKLLIAKLRRMQLAAHRKSWTVRWATGTPTGRAADEPSGKQMRPRCCKTERHRRRRPCTAAVAGAPATRNTKVPTKTQTVSGLRRNAKTTWRRRIGNPGVRRGALQSDPAGSSEAGLCGLRSHRASGGTESAHRTWHRWSGAVSSVASVSKYGDHCPPYRQSEIYAREGVELDRSTLADWVGGKSRLLAPLVEALRRHVMAGNKIHGDDTPVPVLAPGRGKTKTGRLWTYVRDDRPAGDATPPAVWYCYTPDRKGEHPKAHLSEFTGTLQADAYAGYERVYEDGRIQEAACWAHVRRKFYDLLVAHKSPVAAEAIERIAKLYAIEDEIRGRPPEERREVRNARSWPLLESLKQWLEGTLGKLSRKSDTAMAVRYALGRWKRCCATAAMVASRSTTMLRNAPCVRWCWEGKTICSMDLMLEASEPRRFTA